MAMNAWQVHELSMLRAARLAELTGDDPWESMRKSVPHVDDSQFHITAANLINQRFIAGAGVGASTRGSVGRSGPVNTEGFELRVTECGLRALAR
jgi:hypothetical protein